MNIDVNNLAMCQSYKLRNFSCNIIDKKLVSMIDKGILTNLVVNKLFSVHTIATLLTKIY